MDQLLLEYGLTAYKYDALCCCQSPTFWKQGGLTHSITTLYGLVEQGMLTGPEKGKAHSAPFELTPKGREILARIERGLHHPDSPWWSEAKCHALKVLCGQPTTLSCGKGWLNFRGVHLPTLRALEKAGYTKQQQQGTLWCVTDLGREAYAERQSTNEKR